MESFDKVLNCGMGHNDAKASTIREYLLALLRKLWNDGEGFSGKRPFGNSGWEYEIYTALVSNSLIDGKLDSDGYVQDCDTTEANRLILGAISAL